MEAGKALLQRRDRERMEHGKRSQNVKTEMQREKDRENGIGSL